VALNAIGINGYEAASILVSIVATREASHEDAQRARRVRCVAVRCLIGVDADVGAKHGVSRRQRVPDDEGGSPGRRRDARQGKRVKTVSENLDVKRGSSLWLLFAVAIIAAGGLRVSSGRAAGTADSASDSLRLRTVAEFELPSPPGKRCDYLTIDEDDNYLLSAHLAAGLRRVGSGNISVFQMDDPTHFRKLKDVPVEPKIHSLAVDPKTHRVYA